MPSVRDPHRRSSSVWAWACPRHPPHSRPRAGNRCWLSTRWPADRTGRWKTSSIIARHDQEDQLQSIDHLCHLHQLFHHIASEYMIEYGLQKRFGHNRQLELIPMPDEDTWLLHGHDGYLQADNRLAAIVSIDRIVNLPENSHRSRRQTIRASLGTDAETQYAGHADAARQPICQTQKKQKQ